MGQLFKNFARSTLAASLATGATSLTVPTGHGARFPAITGSDYFLLVLQDATNTEVVKVTARSGDSMVLLRAQEGTTSPASFAAGTIVSQRLTAATVTAAMAHVEDTTAAHAASAIGNTPAGNLAATDVQSALNELQGNVNTVEAAATAAQAGVTAANLRLVPVGSIVYAPQSSGLSGFVRMGSYVTKALYPDLVALVGGSTSVVDLRLTNLPLRLQKFNQATAMPTWLRRHDMVALTDGRALVVGGYNGAVAQSATYFGTPGALDTVAITWVSGTAMPEAKNGVKMVKLADGRVLVTGGMDAAGVLSNRTYFGTISGNTITWVAGTNMPMALTDHTLTRPTFTGYENRVVLMGGYDGTVARAEIYYGDVSGNTITWTLASTLTSPLTGHAAVATNNNTMFVIGGASMGVGSPRENEVHWYVLNPTGGVISQLRGPLLPHNLTYANAINYDTTRNNFLIVGGIGADFNKLRTDAIAMSADESISAAAEMAIAGAGLPYATALAAMCVLQDGRVLYTGGYREGGQTTSDCYLSKPLFPWMKT